MINQYRYHAGQFNVKFQSFRLTGSDVESFLQNQSTFDTDKLKDKEFHLDSFLDPQGRVESYGWLLKDGADYLYLTPELLKEQTLERLNRYLISEDVEILGPHVENWTFYLGPKAINDPNYFEGLLFDERAYLSSQEIDAPEINQNDQHHWRLLTGWPSFDGSDYSKEIINNLRLFDLSVIQNKGCYPGQETVSKIATRRGAAYAPVLIEVPQKLDQAEISQFDRKIGTILESVEWDGKFYSPAQLLRDFRVEGMKLQFNLSSGIVRYYPLISGNQKAKAEELFYKASTFFQNGEEAEAEKCFRLAMDIDPKFADAYEGLGVMLGRQERFREAVDVMRKLSEVDPSSVLAHTNLSLFLMRLGKIDEAEKQKSLATVKSFQKFGEEAKIKAELAKEQKAKSEEWLKRESMFMQVLEIDEDDTLANYGIGSIAVEKGEWERARSHLEKVLKADPKYSVAYLALGKAYLSLGLKDLAKSTWNEGIKIAASKGDLMPANQMHTELERL